MRRTSWGCGRPEAVLAQQARGSGEQGAAARRRIQRQLTDDSNIGITGRDLREREPGAAAHPANYRAGVTLSQ